MGAAIPFIIAGASQMGGSISQAKALKNQAKFEENQANFNAEMADLNAVDATYRGDRKANEIKRNARRIKGAQRSGFASQGVLVDSGSAADITSDTQDLSEQDILTVKNNAWREAFGFRTQASNYRIQGRMAMAAAKTNIGSTLLTGGMMGASSFVRGYNQYRGTGQGGNN